MSRDFLPYGRHLIDEDDIDAVTRVLRSQPLTGGSEVSAFEQELASVIGSKETVVVSNGTTALAP